MAHRLYERIAKAVISFRLLLVPAAILTLSSCRSGTPSVLSAAADKPLPRPSSTNVRAPVSAAKSAATAPPLAPIAPQLIQHLRTTERIIALTFDACQIRKPARYDPKIIRILRETHTPATLLLGGRWMEAHPKETRDIAADPLFEIGNHSYIHPHMTKIPVEQMKAEIRRTQNMMYRLTGRQGTLFRPPYGEYDDRLVATAGELGLRTLMWNVETGDPDPRESARAITRTVLTRARPGSIVIMHVNGRGWHSAEALPTIIRQLRSRGFRFVRVSEGLN